LNGRYASGSHDGAVTAALDQLLSILDLEPIERNIFRGRSPEGTGHVRVFGGQVAAQALVAAGRTVGGEGGAGAGEGGAPRPVHSLHSYFLRPGDPTIPILYLVDRIRDGRSFTTRRVAAVQRGEPIFHLVASFHIREDGLSHQQPMPPAPDPESLPTWRERMAPYAEAMGDFYSAPKPIDMRPVGDLLRYRVAEEGRAEPHQQVWLRADGDLGDDPLIHACVAAYASDMTLLETVMLPHGVIWEERRGFQASLDHAMWFHRPFRADHWLLYDQRSPSAAGARGLAVGSLFSRDGTLAVSVVQEGLIRTQPR
jgi:acyl-CoA thioesterase-2